MRTQVQSLALLSGLRIQRCHELWCRSQMWLRSDISVAVAGSNSSNLTPRLGISICHRCSLKKAKKKRQKAHYSLSFPRPKLPHLQHMEIPRPGDESELQLPAYTTATAT